MENIKFNTEGFLICELIKSQEILDLLEIIKLNLDLLNNYDTNNFRNKILLIQNELKKSELIKNFIKINYNQILPILINDNNKTIVDDFHYSTNIFLRAVRPSVNIFNSNHIEFLGLHRERFYGGEYASKQINIHIPLFHYTTECAMKYIPNSHIIPDEDIKVQNISTDLTGIERGSVGHKIGLTYSPKEILSGVDMSLLKSVPMNINQFMIFNSNLIHGGGINNTNKIRFSMDFAIIKSHYIDTNNQPKHLASLNPDKLQYIQYHV